MTHKISKLASISLKEICKTKKQQTSRNGFTVSGEEFFDIFVHTKAVFGGIIFLH
jgi:hypothetical protein